MGWVGWMEISAGAESMNTALQCYDQSERALQCFKRLMRWSRMRNNKQDTHQPPGINMMHISEHCNKTDHLSRNLHFQQELNCWLAFVFHAYFWKCIFELVFLRCCCNKSVIAGRGNVSLCWFLRRLLCINNVLFVYYFFNICAIFVQYLCNICAVAR